MSHTLDIILLITVQYPLHYTETANHIILIRRHIRNIQQAKKNLKLSTVAMRVEAIILSYVEYALYLSAPVSCLSCKQKLLIAYCKYIGPKYSEKKLQLLSSLSIGYNITVQVAHKTI